MGKGSIRFIHDLGRGLSPGFVNTNTGYFGVQIPERELAVRSEAPSGDGIKHSTLDCSDDGSTGREAQTKPEPDAN